MLFVNKQKQIEKQIKSYNEQISVCMDVFREAMKGYCESPEREKFRESTRHVHRAEGRADDIRREIQVLMYSKALFPESRGDILGLLEAMDKVPNHTESTVQMILDQHIAIPKDFCPLVMQIVDTTCRCVSEMIDAVESLFTNYMNATVIVGKIDELESEVDHVEADCIDRIFSSSLDGIEKILLRDLVKHMAGISDRAENVGDRLRIICAKRSI
jgi:predicted phosphate transport protein (TIGR00153 family)